MCGISGAYRHSGLPDGLPHVQMRDALRHRGPDEQACHVAARPDGRPFAILSATRLSIVDVNGGQQPVSSPDGRFWVTMNGEIYNHSTLRRREEARGLTPRNGSDTALVAAMLSVLPVETVLNSLQGMFTLAILDSQTRRLILARDRMGVKPLYTTTLPNGVVLWSSELKGILSHPGVPRTIDPIALRQYLMFEYIPSPRSIYAGIRKLPPGCLLELTPSGTRERRWWSPPSIKGVESGGSIDKWATSVGRALRVAVHCRMEADVPVGYLLSGGLDSSAVAAAARERAPSAELHTFSMKVDAPGFDESAKAYQIATSIGAIHHEARLDPPAFLETAEEIWAMLDEPLADSSLVATWALLRGVHAAGFRCVQSGDGADEAFGGYQTYLAHQLAGPATLLRRPLGRIARRLPVQHTGVTTGYMARRFVTGLGAPWARRHQIWMGAWDPEEVGAQPEDWSIVDEHAARARSENSNTVSQAMYLDQRLYLAGGVLVKVDRASMAHSVEVRSPFLDYRLVDLAADIPTQMKVRGRQNKRVLRRAVKDWLPTAITQGKKKGFGSPVGPWLRGPCRHLLDDLPEKAEDMIQPDHLRRCISEHISGSADHRRRLWSAVVLTRWRCGRWGPG